MTNEEAQKMLIAKIECMKREASGIDQDCNYRNCDECELCYKQGTTGDRIEALNMAVKALITVSLQPSQSKQLKVLVSVLDGCPLTQPCDKMWRGGWCEEHCKNNKLQEPNAECWLKYAEVMAADDT